jgi:hypothetical protein
VLQEPGSSTVSHASRVRESDLGNMLSVREAKVLLFGPGNLKSYARNLFDYIKRDKYGRLAKIVA